MKIYLLILLSLTFNLSNGDQKFVFYDVNPGEGFNLRRDVFMRIAVLVKRLNDLDNGHDYALVLPPWGRLYHWQSRELGQQIKIQWRRFFDVESINRFVPVMDLDQYLEKNEPTLDLVLYLQGYKEGWKSGEFQEKFDYRDCLESPKYLLDANDQKYHSWFWGYQDLISAKAFKCLSIQGSTKMIKGHLAAMDERSIFLDRAETLLHDWFGDEDYWSSRRSMRFSDELIRISDGFRAGYLDSDDVRDDTVREVRWEDQRPARKDSRGGPYLCAHLRRKDYLWARKDKLPSLEGAAQQIERKLGALDLKTVFIATDAPLEEFDTIKGYLEPRGISVFKFNPDKETKKELKDGGVAIVDQIICSHAKHFMGSLESTFTFRIQEEREIMGFQTKATFDIFCQDGKFDCEKGSVWKIVYPEQEKKQKLLQNDEL